ncbi:MAG TPA: hypothetical protein DDZ91_14770 [Firmicutes bacterium]|jgi:hypothetical protein|nr:hypothetical protein [Bacillota bacterium]
MKIVNFSHPLTTEQLQQIAAITNQDVEEVIEVSSQIDPNNSLSPQIEEMLESTGFSISDWQTLALIINLPALNFSSAVMLAHLHGRMGYFPSVLRLRPVSDVVPSRFEVAEIINLQGIREAARKLR